MENYQTLINEALGGGTPKECYNNLMDILQEKLTNKPAVTHHDELVEALRTITNQFLKVEPLYSTDLEIINKAQEVLSKLPQ